jgi:hypothetical protein
MLAKIYVPLKKTILSLKYFLKYNIPELTGTIVSKERNWAFIIVKL